MSDFVLPEWIRPKAVLRPRPPLIGGGELTVAEVVIGPDAQSSTVVLLRTDTGFRQKRSVNEVVRHFQPSEQG